MTYIYVLKMLEAEPEHHPEGHETVTDLNGFSHHQFDSRSPNDLYPLAVDPYPQTNGYSHTNGSGPSGHHHRSSARFSKHGGNEMHLCANALGRDRLSFSKSILRRFIRDCVDRDAAVASPWTVKLDIAQQYGVETEMPENVKRGIDGVKKGEKEKRKKVWVDKNGAEGAPPKKKARKMTAEERGMILPFLCVATI